jgi:hypothetical protein
MGGLASAPGIRNIGDPINLSTPGGILYVDASGDFQEDTTNLFADLNNFFTLTLFGRKLGTFATANNDRSTYVFGQGAGGAGGAIPASSWNNIAIGSGALQAWTNGADNIAIGYGALNILNNSTDIVAIGSNAGKSLNTSGSNPHSVFVGSGAGANIAQGQNLTAIGYNALKGTVGAFGSSNTAVGQNTLSVITTGTGNTAIGNNVGNALSTGGNNVFVGGSGNIVASGSSNVVVGQAAAINGQFSACVLVGQNTQAAGNNAINVGNSGVATPANNMHLGNPSITNTTLYGAVAFQGALDVATAGAGVAVKEGANCKQGTDTLVAGTKLVNNTAVTANSRIFLTTQTPGGTPGALYVSARVAGTSFTVTSTSGADTSTFAYEIFEPG